MSEKDRELQIRLAEIQTDIDIRQADVQINIAALLSFFGVYVAIIVWFEQLFFSSSGDFRKLMAVLIILFTIGVLIPLSILIERANGARSGIKDIRKEYAKLREKMKGIDEDRQLLKEILIEVKAIEVYLINLKLEKTKHQEDVSH